MGRRWGDRRLGGAPFLTGDNPVILSTLWEGDLSDPEWETQFGQEFNNPTYPNNALAPAGIAGVSPTISATATPAIVAGIDRRFWFPSMGLDPVPGGVMLEYDVHFASGHSWGENDGGGKIVGLAGKDLDETVFDIAWGGSRPGDSWSVRAAFSKNGQIGAYFYVADPTSPGYPFGQQSQWGGKFRTGWNNVRIAVNPTMGTMAVGLNGEWDVSFDGLTFTTPLVPATMVALNWGYGGVLADGPATDQTVHFANFRLLAIS